MPTKITPLLVPQGAVTVPTLTYDAYCGLAALRQHPLIDGSRIGFLFVTSTDQFRRSDGCFFGHAHHGIRQAGRQNAVFHTFFISERGILVSYA